VLKSGKHNNPKRVGWLARIFSLRSAARLALLLSAAIALASCSHTARPDPKETIKNMFEAMRLSDSVSLAANIDLLSAARGMQGEFSTAVTDSATAQPDTAARLLSAMVGEGELRQRWLTDNQIVIGRSEISGDTALVEVSFIDRITRVQYYNKMRLVFRSERWVLTDFHTL